MCVHSKINEHACPKAVYSHLWLSGLQLLPKCSLHAGSRHGLLHHLLELCTQLLMNAVGKSQKCSSCLELSLPQWYVDTHRTMVKGTVGTCRRFFLSTSSHKHSNILTVRRRRVKGAFLSFSLFLCPPHPLLFCCSLKQQKGVGNKAAELLQVSRRTAGQHRK